MPNFVRFDAGMLKLQLMIKWDVLRGHGEENCVMSVNKMTISVQFGNMFDTLLCSDDNLAVIYIKSTSYTNAKHRIINRGCNCFDDSGDV